MIEMTDEKAGVGVTTEAETEIGIEMTEGRVMGIEIETEIETETETTDETTATETGIMEGIETITDTETIKARNEKETRVQIAQTERKIKTNELKVWKQNGRRGNEQHARQKDTFTSSSTHSRLGARPSLLR